MSNTPTRRAGRLRTLLVLAAMSLSMIAGTATSALAAPPMITPPGLDNPAAAHGYETAKDARSGDAIDDVDDVVIVPLGYSWF